MNNIQWVFDGIGTAIVSTILGLIVGGICGYKIGIKKSIVKQKQKAGNNSTQVQIGIKDGGK
jgi:biopolymer transport protein ExbB/TolQ